MPDLRQPRAGVDEYLYHRFGRRPTPMKGRTLQYEVFGTGDVPVRPTADAWLPVLVRLRDPDQLPEVTGVRIHSRLGGILTAEVTLPGLEALREQRNVITVEASRLGGTQEMVRSLPYVRGDHPHGPPLDERGDRALLGIVDTGVDVLHETMQHGAPPRTRLVALWVQGDPTGPSPKAGQPHVYGQDYGTLHLPTAIDGWIRTGVVPDPRLRDRDLHGTHVASIAAGTPIPGVFPGGLAPEAPLVVVVPHLVSGPNDPPSLGYSNSHVDALDFIRRTADHLGRPVVVNVSLGMNAGAHDGTSLLEAAFDAFSGGGRDPGYVIVKSAGNERGHEGHAEARVFEGGVTSIAWESLPGLRLEDYIEVWYESGDDLVFTLHAPDGSRLGPLAVESPAVAGALGGNDAAMTLNRFHHDNGDSRLVVTIRHGARTIQVGAWHIEIQARTVTSDGIVHAWVERDDARAVRFRTGDVDEMTLSIPGTAHTTVTVGACEPRDPLRMLGRSSQGPTRDGRKKPDVVAPGVDIQAARAATADHAALTSMSGTSMAAPHVSGAIALLMSHRERRNLPQLNAAQIRAGLTQACAHYSGRWHEGFGYGRLDVKALLDLFGS